MPARLAGRQAQGQRTYGQHLTSTAKLKLRNSAPHSGTHVDRVLRVLPSRADSPQDMPNVARLADQNVGLWRYKSKPSPQVRDKLKCTKTSGICIAGAGVGLATTILTHQNLSVFPPHTYPSLLTQK